MRLIDADKVDFNEVFKGKTDFAKDMREVAQSLIDSQPTAYNIKAVLEEIEKQDDVCSSCRHKDECNECAVG